MPIYKTDKDIFLNNSSNIKAWKISFIDDEHCIFKSNDKIIIPCEEIYSYKKHFKKIYLFKIGYLIGLFLFLSFFWINRYRVSKVIFNGDFLINKNIEEYIESKTKKVLNLKFIDADYRMISRELRANFISYEWIEVKKSGTIIYVTINAANNISIAKKNEDIGSLIAKKDGIIKYYEVFGGKPVIEKNDYVKKGDLLVSSNLVYGMDVDYKTLVHSRGLVLATTYEEISRKVFKRNSKFEFTGNVDVYNKYYLFKKYIAGKSKKRFENYLEEEKSKSYLGIFQIKTILRMEKHDIINIYTKEEALEKVKNQVFNDFLKTRESMLEKIDEIININVIDKDEYFEVNFVLKCLENIAVFKKE